MTTECAAEIAMIAALMTVNVKNASWLQVTIIVHTENGGQTMRLIDADSDKLEELIYDNTYSPEYHRIMRGIQNLPTIDAVQVVRCGECEHYSADRKDDKYGVCRYWQYYTEAPEVCADDFCCHGERREENGT